MLSEHEKGVIVKIVEEKADLLHYLNTLGLVPGTSIEILEKAPFDGPITLQIGANSRALSRAVASIIQVKQTK